MDLSTLLYIVIGGFLGFLAFIFITFQIIGYLLIGKTAKPIDEEQKKLCHDSIHSGDKGSIMCRFYVKKGYCPHGDCKHLKK